MAEPTERIALEHRRDFRWIVGIQATGFLIILGSVVSLFVALKGGSN